LATGVPTVTGSVTYSSAMTPAAPAVNCARRRHDGRASSSAGPNTAGQVAEWFVPNETSSLTVNQTSTVPAMFDIGAGAGDPDLASSAPGAGPLCASTASVTYAPPGAVVTPGQWVAGAAGCGPYTGPGAAGTATDSLSIQAKAFDPTITASLGDYNLTAINPQATPAMTVLQPGDSIVVPVTITPSGTAGSVVRGEIPDRCVVAGVPARVIREHTDAGWLSPNAPA